MGLCLARWLKKHNDLFSTLNMALGEHWTSWNCRAGQEAGGLLTRSPRAHPDCMLEEEGLWSGLSLCPGLFGLVAG